MRQPHEVMSTRVAGVEKKIQIFESMIYHAIEVSLRERKEKICTFAASFKIERRRAKGNIQVTMRITFNILSMPERRWREKFV